VAVELPAQPPRRGGTLGLLHALLHASLRAALGATVLALAACIVLPHTRSVYDPECNAYRREVVLEAAHVGGFNRCYGDGCVVMLAAVGLVTAASVVVSGSIAVVGNVVYWLERKGGCAPPGVGDAAPPRPPPPPGAGPWPSPNPRSAP
jgi:hypothetical protein